MLRTCKHCQNSGTRPPPKQMDMTQKFPTCGRLAIFTSWGFLILDFPEVIGKGEKNDVKSRWRYLHFMLIQFFVLHQNKRQAMWDWICNPMEFLHLNIKIYTAVTTNIHIITGTYIYTFSAYNLKTPIQNE